MEYRRFGRTRLSMPVFSCGGMRYQQSWKAGDPISEANQRNLQATIDAALAVGITHIETARGYGTSESQLGEALSRHPRSSFILQTKVTPKADAREFETHLEESFDRLRVSHVDLFGFHGVNTAEWLGWVLAPGGCGEVAQRWRRQGRIGHVGFSTHASVDIIVRAIDSNLFDYVNLHYYYIFQENLAAVRAARERDMGVFIISPTDKGGRLQDPSPRLQELCAPLSPMVFNDLFCLANPDVHTLSVGAARPGDFAEHLLTLPLLADPGPALDPVKRRLLETMWTRVGPPFAGPWEASVPDWDRLPGGVNARLILRLRALALAYDLLPYARERYSNLTGRDHWVQGSQAKDFDDRALLAALPPSSWRDKIPQWLRESHQLLG